MVSYINCDSWTFRIIMICREMLQLASGDLSGGTISVYEQRTEYKHVKLLGRCNLEDVSQRQDMSVGLIGACGTSISGSLGDHLLCIHSSRQESFSIWLRHLRPAHWLLANQGDCRLSQWWKGCYRSIGSSEMSILPFEDFMLMVKRWFYDRKLHKILSVCWLSCCHL